MSIDYALRIFPNIERLDVSFTALTHLSLINDMQPPRLQKLCLTSTAINSKDLVDVVSQLPALRYLAIGALGAGLITNATAKTLTDDDLRRLTDILERFSNLEKVNLVGNPKLGRSSKANSALPDFVTRVGRKLKVCEDFCSHWYSC